MSSDVERGWRRLMDRVRSPIRDQLTDLQHRVVLGASRNAEVSAATFGFPDQSFMILLDHGLTTLTWLAAALFAVHTRARDAASFVRSDDTARLGEIPPDIAARVLRLTMSRLAAGGTPGVTPPLKLSAAEIVSAGALVAEMDTFVIAHEAAHILLGHVSSGRPAGIIGSGRLLGKAAAEESAADHLAIRLMFDDAQDGEIGLAEGQRRVAAVRLFLALIDMFERAMFFVQPTSHPSAHRRWSDIRRSLVRAMEPEVVSASMSDVEQFVDVLAAIDPHDRRDDALIVDRALGDRLDETLWSLRDWTTAAAVADIVCATDKHAVQAVHAWNRRAKTRGAPSVPLEQSVDQVLASAVVRKLLLGQFDGGEPVTRLQAVTTVLEQTAAMGAQAPDDDPFPAWAPVALALNAVRHAADARDDGSMTAPESR